MNDDEYYCHNCQQHLLYKNHEIDLISCEFMCEPFNQDEPQCHECFMDRFIVEHKPFATHYVNQYTLIGHICPIIECGDSLSFVDHLVKNTHIRRLSNRYYYSDKHDVLLYSTGVSSSPFDQRVDHPIHLDSRPHDVDISDYATIDIRGHKFYVHQECDINLLDLWIFPK